MQVDAIPGANAVLGAPEKWDVKAEGQCIPLPVIRTQSGYISQWRPSREEIRRLVAGAPIHLYVFGQGHPPVAIEVVDPAAAPHPSEVT